ncbi:MAG: hypothetical protein ACRDU4_19485 [Mycobacterium sp.]
MQRGQAAKSNAIDWVKAVFGGACSGGVMWAIVARLTIYSGYPDDSIALKWIVLVTVCLGLVIAGWAVARWAGKERLRTAGVAVVIAPLTGGLLLAIVAGLVMLQ